MKIFLYHIQKSLGLKEYKPEQIAEDFVNNSERDFLKKYVEAGNMPTDFCKYFYIQVFIAAFYDATLDYTNDNLYECFKEIKKQIDEILEVNNFIG